MKLGIIASLVATSSAEHGSPIAKIIQMISDLQSKVVAEGEESQKVYEEFAEWCEETSKTLQYEIKTGKREVANLKATIASEDANILTQTSTIEALAAEIATDSADLKAASQIREKEASNFDAVEKDLVETIDILERAIGVIEKEQSKGASMMQLKGASGMAQALAAMVQAQSLTASDGKKLTVLLQNADDDDSTGAPDPTVFESSSGGILAVLNDTLEKAQAQLEDARGKEKSDLQNFEMLKQSLDDEIAFGNKEMSEAHKSKSTSEEGKAVATGDLEVTTNDLNNDNTELDQLHHECMTKANEFEAETNSRGEELKALATAKKIIIEATSFGQMSFLQSALATSEDLKNFEVTRMLRDLAKKHHDTLLSQLASRVNSVVRYGGGNKNDVFAKIKGLISDMIEKLEGEAQADATEKAFCDKELAETRQKKADKEAEIEKISAKIDKMAARSKQLKTEVAGLQNELAELSKSQAEMDKIRAEEKAQYSSNKAETEKALTGVKKALSVLNEYYAKADKAHNAADADGSSTGIIGLLEVCESDFSKGLAELIQTEATAVRDYDAQSKENEITRVTKEQDVKYKNKEAAGLDKSVTEYDSDRSGVQTELAAVNEYLRGLEGRCIAKAETYAERKSRREAEIQGLNDALQTLESLSFVEVKTTRNLRLRRFK